MSTPAEDFDPFALSDEEIELYLNGDQRDIDRLLLKSINRLTALIVPHVKADASMEEAWNDAIARLGGLKRIEERATYVDALLEKQRNRSAAFRKISESTVLWALVVVLGFVLKALWDAVLTAVKVRMP